MRLIFINNVQNIYQYSITIHKIFTNSTHYYSNLMHFAPRYYIRFEMAFFIDISYQHESKKLWQLDQSVTYQVQTDFDVASTHLFKWWAGFVVLGVWFFQLFSSALHKSPPHKKNSFQDLWTEKTKAGWFKASGVIIRQLNATLAIEAAHPT